MYIARQAETQFLKALESGKIMVLTGARQVGKTYAVLEFGNKNYDNVVYFNSYC